MTKQHRLFGSFLLIGAMVFGQIGQAFAASASVCAPKGYAFMFFNGVGNTGTQANIGLERLKALEGETKNSLQVTYDVAYNWTGSTVGASGMQDIAETFIQRSKELDPSGELGKNVYLIWDLVGSAQPTGLWDTITKAVPAIADSLSLLYQDLLVNIGKGLSTLLSNPQTDANYAEQNARITDLATQGQMLLFVAHSQGNLFANHAYDTFAPIVGSQSIQVVHIAPASPTLRGNHVLADIDLVINGLRIQGLSTVQPVNMKVPLSTGDLSGHTLIGTYLDGQRQVQVTSAALRGGTSRDVVVSMMDDAFNALVAPVATGNVGSLTVTLTWDGPGDVDLHVLEPTGSHVFYGATTGASGFLDIDNTVANGPEHYYSTCDASKLALGTYSIGINDYHAAAGRTATVQVASQQDGVLATRQIDVGPARGNSGNLSPIPVVNVTVSKDGDGGYQYTVN